MPNQHTKRKERLAANAAKKATGAYKKTQANHDEKPAAPRAPEMHVHAINLAELFASRFPQMGRVDEKAKNQPHFTLLANDNFTPVLIRKWIDMAIDKGTPIEKIREAKLLLKNIEQWRTANPTACKTPD